MFRIPAAPANCGSGKSGERRQKKAAGSLRLVAPAFPIRASRIALLSHESAVTRSKHATPTSCVPTRVQVDGWLPGWLAIPFLALALAFPASSQTVEFAKVALPTATEPKLPAAAAPAIPAAVIPASAASPFNQQRIMG